MNKVAIFFYRSASFWLFGFRSKITAAITFRLSLPTSNFVGQPPLSDSSSEDQVQLWHRFHSSRRSLIRRKHKHILPLRSSNLDDVLILNLHIPRLFNLLPIQFGPIGTLQIHQIWPHNIHLLRLLFKL